MSKAVQNLGNRYTPALTSTVLYMSLNNRQSSHNCRANLAKATVFHNVKQPFRIF